MTRIIAASTLAAVLALAAADANAWERNRSVNGPRGTASQSVTGSCANSACTRSATGTGPLGRTATRQGQASCADGTCSGSRTSTGPNGGTVTRQGSVSR